MSNISDKTKKEISDLTGDFLVALMKLAMQDASNTGVGLENIMATLANVSSSLAATAGATYTANGLPGHGEPKRALEIWARYNSASKSRFMDGFMETLAPDCVGQKHVTDLRTNETKVFH